MQCPLPGCGLLLQNQAKNGPLHTHMRCQPIVSSQWISLLCLLVEDCYKLTQLPPHNVQHTMYNTQCTTYNVPPTTYQLHGLEYNVLLYTSHLPTPLSGYTVPMLRTDTRRPSTHTRVCAARASARPTSAYSSPHLLTLVHS